MGPVGPRDDDLTLALSLADAADAITMARHRAPDLRVETKSDATPVTEADQAVERTLRKLIGEERPDDAIVGEEYGEDRGVSGRRWILDPIDGTKSYVRGLPTWSTLIALADETGVEVAVVSMPALGRRWWASRGEGAFAGGPQATSSPDGTALRVSAVRELGEAHLGWSGLEDWEAVGRGGPILSLVRECWRSRGIGDAWQYTLVAEGVLDIATDPAATLWDLAAPSLIVQEAGGRFTDLAGADGPDGGSGVASNGLLHEAVLGLLAERS